MIAMRNIYHLRLTYIKIQSFIYFVMIKLALSSPFPLFIMRTWKVVVNYVSRPRKTFFLPFLTIRLFSQKNGIAISYIIYLFDNKTIFIVLFLIKSIFFQFQVTQFIIFWVFSLKLSFDFLLRYNELQRQKFILVCIYSFSFETLR